MTEAELKACRDLISTPPFWNPISKEEFLRRYPTAVERGRVALRILEHAYDTRNAGELQCALVVGFTFGFGPEHQEILCALVFADWHRCLGDVLSALVLSRTPGGGISAQRAYASIRSAGWPLFH